MKKVFYVFIFIVFGNILNAQTNLISSTQLNGVKIRMSIDAFNKLTNQQVVSKASANDNGAYFDTVKTEIKGVPVTIVFFPTYNEKVKNEIGIYSIQTSHISVKTKSGIGIGSNKFDVIKKLDGFSLQIYPDWMKDEKIRKKYSVVILNDSDNGTELKMYFENNILYSFEVQDMGEGC